MNLGLQGKTALVTGGARGIGAAIVKVLADEGAAVHYTSRSQPDVTLPQAVDILVNNVGSTLGMQDPHGDYGPVMDLNFNLAVRMCNLYIPGMKERGWGRIVNISSCSGMEQRGPVAFTCAKAALTSYTRSMGLLLAKESPEVVMTAVFPGVVFTDGGHWDKVMQERPEHAERYLRDQVPVGRFGTVEEIAPFVAFLCSELASFCHGGLYPVDGGLSKHFWNQVAA